MGEGVRSLLHLAALAAMVGLFAYDRFGASIAVGVGLFALGYLAEWLIGRRTRARIGRGGTDAP